MIFDEVDVHILREILLNKEISTWQIAKKFNWKEECPKDNDFYDQKNSLINVRLKKMCEAGIMKKHKENNRNVYTMLKDKTEYIKRHRFKDCVSEAISIKDRGKWITLQV